MATKRIYKLGKGDQFRWYQSEYIVTKITDRIYFKMLCAFGTRGGDVHSFGLLNQSKVEIIEKPHPSPMKHISI